MTSTHLPLIGATALATLVTAGLGALYSGDRNPPPAAPVASADGDAIRDYLLANPEVIREALVVLEQRRLLDEARAEEALIAEHANAIFDDGFSYVGGNPDGSITLVEFQDYRCGYCKRAHDEVQQLVAEDGDIRIIIKEFPILGPDSTLSSQLAIATMISEGPDRYKALSDALMTYGGPVNDAAMARLARSADVDIDAISDLRDDPEVARRIAQTHELARTLSISGTPTFIIGNKMVRGYLPLAEMKKMVALVREAQN